MSESRPTSPASPWHEGERRMQQHLGVAERMAEIGTRLIRDFMPDQHRQFYEQLPFLVVAAVDESGDPWATLLDGDSGFVWSPDPRLLRIDRRPAADDPVGGLLQVGAAVGLLGIELPTRRRNRMNGTVVALDAAGFAVAVTQAFGNCPKYIQSRTVAPAASGSAPSAALPPPAGAVERAGGLDDEARATIAAADTFFVASSADPDGDPARRAVDVSHRGGHPGFVRIDQDVLTIPDFSGNLQFNTLGNLLLHPRAGLVFVDFATGDLLHLAGATEIVHAGPEVEAFRGAERLWRCTVRQLVRRRGALRLRGSAPEVSPATRATGSWREVEAPRREETPDQR